jgi:hypothetical protein
VVVALVAIVVLVIGLPVAALVLGPRLGPPKAHPRSGGDDRTHLLARELGEPTATEPPAGLTPGECGVLAAPKAHYQHLTATLLDLARRGHLRIVLRQAPTDIDDTAWWTLTAAGGFDELRDYERTLLAELRVGHHPAEFPSLTNGSADRVHRRLRRAAKVHTTDTGAALALQRGVAQDPVAVDARWFAHTVACDVSAGFARSLTARHIPTPPWITTACDTPITWVLVQQLAVTGSPLLPQGPFQAGYIGSPPVGH